MERKSDKGLEEQRNKYEYNYKYEYRYEYKYKYPYEQRKIQFVQNRLTPYFLIMLFTLAISCMRFYMVPEWSIGMQVFAFFTQIIIMSCMWQLIKWLSKVLDNYLPFSEGPLFRVLFQLFFTLLLLSPIVFFGVKFAQPYLPAFVNKQFIVISTVLFVVMVALFNFSFYASYFYKNWQESVIDKAELQIQAAQLEKEKFDLQYHQLRNQVNPHYLFNTLTSLDGLIHTNPELASEFVRHMAKVYRYVLQHKESEVVRLYEELDFIQHYIELLHIRYAGGLVIQHNITDDASDKGVVMVTLQMLIDNAVKHNIVQASAPLQVHITDDDEYLIVSNNKQLRGQVETSNGQGLKQLCQLYAYLTEKQIIIEDTDDNYTIKIPLL